ncbi:MAG: hypothetical protein GC185_07610 [Alphaproteobacteria bacterium]|nr:hypothetical protein [Alphaproteobacteria bacterium]
MKKFIEKCKKNYAGMTPEMQANVRNALRAVLLSPLLVAYIWYEDGWGHAVALVLFWLAVFFFFALPIWCIALVTNKLAGNSERGQKIGTFIGVAFGLCVLVGGVCAFFWYAGHRR